MHSNNPPVDTRQRVMQFLDLEVVGYAAVLLATACWATSALFTKLILVHADVSALSLAFWRDISTFLVFFLVLAVVHPNWLRVSRQDLPWLVAMGSALGIFHVFWNLGVFLNGAAVATVQQAAMPAIVAAAAWVIWREPLTWWKVLAIILTFVGTALVSGVGDAAQADFTLRGFLVGLGIPIGYATWNLLGKRARMDHAPPTVLVYAFGFAALVLLPFQFFTPQPWPVSPTVLAYLVGLVLVTGGAGFTLYTFALGRLQASIATILSMAEIPFVAIYALAWFGERLSLLQLTGAILVIVGVLLLFRRKERVDAVPALEGGDG